MYNELPANEQQEIEQALQHDAELAATCADLLMAQRTLNTLRYKPGQRSTEAILQYSRTFLRSA
ncbi:hypothetical protein [Hymenobacter sp. BT190]|uniref:hypothetical protein n=1 Tax=Hymenobacter sp. BT190 TaxID=2763505 RepID=UPI00165161D9|nr:hypothetical protein [Hymenobacter sp. BT190]MBC6699644.1 hypothetical protein [Hymenobacter sp. BT190]